MQTSRPHATPRFAPDFLFLYSENDYGKTVVVCASLWSG